MEIADHHSDLLLPERRAFLSRTSLQDLRPTAMANCMREPTAEGQAACTDSASSARLARRVPAITPITCSVRAAPTETKTGQSEAASSGFTNWRLAEDTVHAAA